MLLPSAVSDRQRYDASRAQRAGVAMLCLPLRDRQASVQQSRNKQVTLFDWLAKDGVRMLGQRRDVLGTVHPRTCTREAGRGEAVLPLQTDLHLAGTPHITSQHFPHALDRTD